MMYQADAEFGVWRVSMIEQTLSLEIDLGLRVFVSGTRPCQQRGGGSRERAGRVHKGYSILLDEYR